MNISLLNLSVAQLQTRVPITILRAEGKLNALTYLDMIAKSQEIYISGQRNLLVDLGDVSEIGLAGLYALYYAALLFQEKEVMDVAGGWSAFHTLADRLQASPFDHFRLLGSQAKIVKTMQQAGLPIADNLAGAVAAFQS